MAHLDFRITVKIGDDSLMVVEGLVKLAGGHGESVGVESVSDAKGYPLPSHYEKFALAVLSGPALQALRDAYDAEGGDEQDRLAAAELEGRSWL